MNRLDFERQVQNAVDLTVAAQRATENIRKTLPDDTAGMLVQHHVSSFARQLEFQATLLRRLRELEW